MEVGELLKQMIYLVVPIVAIIVFISIAWNFSGQSCKPNIGGGNSIILASLQKCVESCWSKHDFGADLYIDDCFVVNVTTANQMDKDNMESSMNKTIPVKVYFDLLEANKTYKIKIKYNSTGKEISLVEFGVFE
jgi:hypothetical protein